MPIFLRKERVRCGGLATEGGLEGSKRSRAVQKGRPRQVPYVCTETACHKVGQDIVAKYGKTLTKEVVAKALGKRPLESWDIIRQELDIPATAQELFDQSEPELLQRYGICTLPWVMLGRPQLALRDHSRRVHKTGCSK